MTHGMVGKRRLSIRNQCVLLWYYTPGTKNVAKNKGIVFTVFYLMFNQCLHKDVIVPQNTSFLIIFCMQW